MSLSKFLARLRRDDRGFSMVVTLGAMSMLMLSAAISINVVTSDTPVGKSDLDRKRAYAAAESGLQVYVHKLLDDNAYWTKCSDAPNAVNNVWTGTDAAADPRAWRNIREQSPDLIDSETPDGRRETAAYTIETLPANGAASCLASQPEESRIDSRTGTFRVRVTGQSLDGAGQRVGPKRSIIASFKRRSFLDYIYFTDLEVLDPATYDSRYNGTELTRISASNPTTVSQWGEEYCASYAYQRHPGNNTLREDQTYRGQKWVPSSRGGSWQNMTADCVEIQFATNDAIRGPLHTNDKPLLCGRPKFGRDPDERVEVSAPSTNGAPSGSYRSACDGTEPYVNYDDQRVRYGDAGTWFYNEPLMQLPDSNSSLQSEAPPQYTFVGETTIRLNHGTINVTGKDATGLVLNNRSMAYPPDGVIYVRNAPANCTKGYQVGDPQDAESPGSRTGCGIAWVNGPYDTSLTIAAEDDIRINGHIDRSDATDPLLGLIAQNFIRVHHPMSSQSAQDSCAADGRGGSNGSGSISNLRVEAALLTLRHSFIVDNWACGSALGTLYVDGAISQRYRGPVATGSASSTSSGYVKSYTYDNRLRFRSPPKFLDPVAASWRIQSYQEQVPAQ